MYICCRAQTPSVYISKRCPYCPSQCWPYMIIHNPYWLINCAKYTSFFEFSSVIRSMWVLRFIFTVLIQISALNPKSIHYVTLATPKTVLVRWAKVFIWRKVVPPARVMLGSHLRQNLDKFVLITKKSVKSLSSVDHAKCDLLVFKGAVVLPRSTTFCEQKQNKLFFLW